jgi:dolichol-phosphate mannosyltransferase
MRRALIVTPTYQERENLPRLLESIFSHSDAVDVLVVDDGSPDGTGALADSLAKENPRIHVMHRAGKLGLGTAYVEGFQWGLARDYDYFFEMDADLSHDAKYLPAFFTALEDGVDVVVGSRNIPGGSVEGWGLGRHLISKGGSLYSRTILGVDVRDLTGGYNAFTRRALEELKLSTLRSNGYSFQIEMKFRAKRRHLRVKEVPIVFVDRQVGQSKMSRKIFLEAVGIVWKLRAESLWR